MKARDYLVSVSALAIALACGWLVTAVKLPPVADDLVLILLLLWFHHHVATHKLVGMLSISFLLLFALSLLTLREGRSHPTVNLRNRRPEIESPSKVS